MTTAQSNALWFGGVLALLGILVAMIALTTPEEAWDAPAPDTLSSETADVDQERGDPVSEPEEVAAPPPEIEPDVTALPKSLSEMRRDLRLLEIEPERGVAIEGHDNWVGQTPGGFVQLIAEGDEVLEAAVVTVLGYSSESSDRNVGSLMVSTGCLNIIHPHSEWADIWSVATDAVNSGDAGSDWKEVVRMGDVDAHLSFTSLGKSGSVTVTVKPR